MDCSLPGSSVHGISQARMLEWVASSSSRGIFPPRDWIHVSCVFCIGRQILYPHAKSLQLCPTLCNPIDGSPPGSPVRLPLSVQFSRSVVSDPLRPHELQHARPPCPSPLLEFTQTHAHRVGDAIQPSHPLLSPSAPAPNPSQHQGLFQFTPIPPGNFSVFLLFARALTLHGEW